MVKDFLLTKKLKGFKSQKESCDKNAAMVESADTPDLEKLRFDIEKYHLKMAKRCK